MQCIQQSDVDRAAGCMGCTLLTAPGVAAQTGCMEIGKRCEEGDVGMHGNDGMNIGDIICICRNCCNVLLTNQYISQPAAIWR